MLYTTDLLYTIIVENPIEFCADKEANALQYLTNTFTGINFGGYHIVEVRSIVKISRCSIVPSNLTCNGRINVQFTCLINVIDPYIANMKVYRTDPRITCASDDHTIVVGLTQLEDHKVIQKDQFIPIKIAVPQYEPFKKTITATGSLLHCDTNYIVYKVTGIFSQQHAKDLMFMVNSIKKELELRLEVPDTGFINIFELLFYSYNNTKKTTIEIKSDNFPSWFGPDQIKTINNQVNLLDLIKEASETPKGVDITGFWSRPLAIYRSSPLVVRNKQPMDTELIVEQPANVAISELLNTMRIINVIRDLTVKFNTIDKLSNQRQIWKVIKNYQKPT